MKKLLFTHGRVCRWAAEGFMKVGVLLALEGVKAQCRVASSHVAGVTAECTLVFKATMDDGTTIEPK